MSVSFYDEASLGGTKVAHPQPCADPDGLCAVYGCYDFVSTGVNLSNANAGMLLAKLDLDTEDLCGSIDPDDLIGRILAAKAFLVDDGTADTVYLRGEAGPFGTCHTVLCGVAPGYWTERLDQLQEIAEQAKSIGCKVVWA